MSLATVARQYRSAPPNTTTTTIHAMNWRVEKEEGEEEERKMATIRATGGPLMVDWKENQDSFHHLKAVISIFI